MDSSSGIPFSKQVYREEIVPNLVCGMLIFIYSAFFLMIKPQQVPPALAVALTGLLAAEFIASRISNAALTKGISQGIQDWEGGLVQDEGGRTRLYQAIAELPMRCAVHTFAIFSSYAMLLPTAYRIVPSLRFRWPVIVFSFIGSL